MSSRVIIGLLSESSILEKPIINLIIIFQFHFNQLIVSIDPNLYKIRRSRVTTERPNYKALLQRFSQEQESSSKGVHEK